MSTSPESGQRSSLKGIIIALVIAAALLLAIVLPAERGYDPTGIGKLLGLTALNEPAAKGANVPSEALQDVIGGNETLTAASAGGISEPMALPNPAISQDESAAPHTETVKVTLGLDEKTEIKAQLDKSKVIVYSWTVEGGQVYVDFHGHDPSKGDNYWVRYEEADAVTANHGSLVAPFAGEHGWYWLNISDKPVTITLTVTGYQKKLINYGLLQ
jgi:hypothetical protein